MACLPILVASLSLSYAQDSADANQPRFDVEAAESVPSSVMTYWSPFLSKNLTAMEVMRKSTEVLQNDFKELNSSASRCYSEQLLAALGALSHPSQEPKCEPVNGATGLCRDAQLNQNLEDMKKAGAKPSCTTDWNVVGQMLECRTQDKGAKKWAGLMGRISQILCWDTSKTLSLSKESSPKASFLETAEAQFTSAEFSNKNILNQIREMKRESAEESQKLTAKVHLLEDQLATVVNSSPKDHHLNLLQGLKPVADAPACSATDSNVGHCPHASGGFNAQLACAEECKSPAALGPMCSVGALTNFWPFYAEMWIWNFWQTNCESFMTPADADDDDDASFLEIERVTPTQVLEKLEQGVVVGYWGPWFHPKVKENMPGMQCTAFQKWTDFQMEYWLEIFWERFLDCHYMNGNTANCPWTKQVTKYWAWQIKSTAGFGDISFASFGDGGGYSICNEPADATAATTVMENRMKVYHGLWFLDQVLSSFR